MKPHSSLCSSVVFVATVLLAHTALCAAQYARCDHRACSRQPLSACFTGVTLYTESQRDAKGTSFGGFKKIELDDDDPLVSKCYVMQNGTSLAAGVLVVDESLSVSDCAKRCYANDACIAFHFDARVDNQLPCTLLSQCVLSEDDYAHILSPPTTDGGTYYCEAKRGDDGEMVRDRGVTYFYSCPESTGAGFYGIAILFTLLTSGVFGACFGGYFYYVYRFERARNADEPISVDDMCYYSRLRLGALQNGMGTWQIGTLLILLAFHGGFYSSENEVTFRVSAYLVVFFALNVAAPLASCSSSTSATHIARIISIAGIAACALMIFVRTPPPASTALAITSGAITAFVLISIADAVAHIRYYRTRTAHGELDVRFAATPKALVHMLNTMRFQSEVSLAMGLFSFYFGIYMIIFEVYVEPAEFLQLFKLLVAVALFALEASSQFGLQGRNLAASAFMYCVLALLYALGLSALAAGSDQCYLDLDPHGYGPDIVFAVNMVAIGGALFLAFVVLCKVMERRMNRMMSRITKEGEARLKELCDELKLNASDFALEVADARSMLIQKDRLPFKLKGDAERDDIDTVPNHDKTHVYDKWSFGYVESASNTYYVPSSAPELHREQRKQKSPKKRVGGLSMDEFELGGPTGFKHVGGHSVDSEPNSRRASGAVHAPAAAAATASAVNGEPNADAPELPAPPLPSDGDKVV